MRLNLRNAVLATLLGVLPVVLVPVVVAAAELGMQCSTAGYERLWTPRPAELTVNVPPGDHIVILELLNANASAGSGFAQVGAILVPAPVGLCEMTSGEIGPFTGPVTLELVAEPVGEISVWARLVFVPVPPPTTTTTEPPDTTTTEPPDTTTTTEVPDTTTTTEVTLPPVEVTTTTTTVPPTTTTVPPTTTTVPPTTTTVPPLIPAQDAACVPGGFTVGDVFYPFDDAPEELFDQFPQCRGAFDEESG